MSERMIGRQIGNYVITQELSQGGMGAVFVAEHPQLERRVAIKILDERFSASANISERFLVEAKLIARLKHPNIIDCSDFGMIDGQPYYIMELLEGVELKEVMTADKKMDCAKAAPFIRQIASALQAAHDAGIVHRDLKPANIFVEYGSPPRVRLLDFGIAKLMGGPANSVSMTTTGMVIGTPSTMAPEQAEGRTSEIGPHTDIYSLGVIIYWMLAGRPPFKAKSAALLLAKHITDVPLPLPDYRPDVPVAIGELVARCLAKDPSERPDRAEDIAQAFDEVLGDSAARHICDFPNAPKRATATLSRMSLAETQDGSGARPVLRGPVFKNEPSASAVDLANENTTLGQAAGEATSTQPVGKVGRGWWTYVMVAAVSVGAAVLAVGGFQDSGPKSGDEENTVVVTQPPRTAAALPAAKATRPPSLPKQVLMVSVKQKGGHCRVIIDGHADQSQRAPCRFELARGVGFDLEVAAAGLKPYKRRLQLTKDLQFTLVADGQGGLLERPEPNASDGGKKPEVSVAAKSREDKAQPKSDPPKAARSRGKRRRTARRVPAPAKVKPKQSPSRATAPAAAKVPASPRRKTLGDTLPGDF